jgi:hypothetical protein
VTSSGGWCEGIVTAWEALLNRSFGLGDYIFTARQQWQQLYQQ